MEFKSMKIPAWQMDTANQARGRIFERGLRALPDDVKDPQACFLCGGALTAKDTPQAVCERCNVTYQRLDPAAAREGTGYTMSVIFGLALNALLAHMAPTPEEIKARRLAPFAKGKGR